MSKRIWITWERQRRSIELAKKLKCDLFVLEYTGFMRYPRSIFKTLNILRSTKPDLVFVQNPSMVLAAVACAYKSALGLPLIVDRHTTLRLLEKDDTTLKAIIFKLLHNFTVKVADLTIVTNKYLADLVRTANGRPFVLPDKLPELTNTDTVKLKGQVNLLLISSFGKDEPIAEVIGAMKSLDYENVCLYVTGNYNKVDASIYKSAPHSVVLTGLLGEQEFVNMLFSVDAVMVLTTADHCMLCGCYEAVYAEKPLITSNKEVLKEYFDGAVFVENDSTSIANGIRTVIGDIGSYQNKISRLRDILLSSWEKNYTDLEKELSNIAD